MKRWFFSLLALASLHAEEPDSELCDLFEVEWRVEDWDAKIAQIEHSEPFEPTPFSLTPTIDVFTGNYHIEEEDFVVAGIQPLSARRFYNHKLHALTWLFNPESYLIANFELESRTREPFVGIGSAEGGVLSLHPDAKEGRYSFHLSEHEGMTHTRSGATHPLNISLWYWKEYLTCDDNETFSWRGVVTDGSGGRKEFYSEKYKWFKTKKLKEKCYAGLWHRTHKFRPSIWTPYALPIAWERLPNGNRLSYEYYETRDFAFLPYRYELKKITAYNSLGNVVLGSLSFDKVTRKFKEVEKGTVRGSDGREARYEEAHDFITRAERPSLPPITYRYRDIREPEYKKHIDKIEYPDGRVIWTDYDRDRKVVAQRARLGPKGEALPFVRYEYAEGYTTVYDAENNKTVYRFDGKQVVAVERFEGNHLYRTDRYVWDKATGNLLSQRMESKGLLREVSYRYDARQNVIEERTSDGRESYTQYFRYSENGYNLKLAEWDDYGKKITYKYAPGTNLLSEEFVYEGEKIRQRSFFTYDTAAVCIYKVVDDGSSTNRDDWTDVQMRKTTEVTPNCSLPCYGLPKIVVEKSFDSQQRETFLGQVEYTYAPFGGILTEDHYDSEHVLRYTLKTEYDERERPVLKSDAMGEVTRLTYDSNNNITSIETPKHTLSITYDYVNRPIVFQDKLKEGEVRTRRRSYDRLGRVVIETDERGFETRYAYNAQGKVTMRTRPDGATERWEYDALGNLVKETDARGYVTRREVNFQNQVTAVFYPDGSEEHMTYAPNGQLLSKQSKQGASVHFAYDAFGHVVSSKTFSSDGLLLKSASATYSPFVQLSDTDALGVTTFFSYDSAGRCTGEQCEGRLISYKYDSLGRRTKTILSDRVLCEEFDLCNRVVERRRETLLGEVVLREGFRYDGEGHCIARITDKGTTRFHYNSRGERLVKIDALGQVTTTRYFLCGKEKEVLEILPNGVTCLKRFDCRDREVGSIVSAPDGTKLQETHRLYDASDNVILERRGEVEHRMEYGPGKQLLRIVEAETKETRYSYDKGCLKTIYKPNGETISHSYNELGLLEHYVTKGADYHYVYDAKDQVVEVFDAVSGEMTRRAYNVFGQLVREELAHGVVMQSRYDISGERSALVLPDGSEVRYGHETGFLKSVERGGRVTRYLERDLEGRVVRMALPQGLGEVSYTYDALGRLKAMHSPHFQEEGIEYDRVGNLLGYRYRDAEGEERREYSYDFLSQLLTENGHSYQYDALYNRRGKDGQAYEVNALSQVVSDGVHGYEYDPNGNLAESEGFVFEYDGQNRLIAVKHGVEEVRYHYDPFHRRLRKQAFVSGREVLCERYVWDGNDEIGVVSERGEMLELRVLGEGLGAEVGAAVWMELRGKSYVPLHDHRGGVCVLVEVETGEVAENVRYSAFGEEECGGRGLSPWRFSSKRVDRETGFVFFGRRYYCAPLGRWITPDPEGFKDGPNLYAYVRNGPVQRIDLRGLRTYAESQARVLFPTVDAAWLRDEIRWKGYSMSFFPCMRYDLASIASQTGIPVSPLPRGRVLTFVNGIGNWPWDARESAYFLSRCAGNGNVHACYNATYGCLEDITRAFVEVAFHLEATASKLMRQEWDSQFATLEEGEKILHTCHSEGAAITRNALENYPEEKRNRILVCAIAPAAFISPKLCGGVRHYVSRDFVYWTDFIHKKENEETIVSLKPHEDSPLLDHPFLSPTYAKVIRSTVEYYLTTGELLKE